MLKPGNNFLNMNKLTKIALIWAGSLIFSILIITACSSGFAGSGGGGGGSAGKSTVSINLTGNNFVSNISRSITAEEHAAMDYTITLSRNGYSSITVKGKGGTTVKASVPTGVWNINVTAHLNGVLRGTGSGISFTG